MLSVSQKKVMKKRKCIKIMLFVLFCMSIVDFSFGDDIFEEAEGE